MHKRITAWTVDTALRRIGREQGQAGLTRFVKWYKQLRALPRQFRRQLQRKWACSLAGVALMLTLQPASSWAANFNAGNAAQLITAIDSANTAAGADTVTLTANITLTVVNNSTYGDTGLPVVTSTITIVGNGNTITRDGSADPFRILAVSTAGNLTIQNTTISNGYAPYVSSSGTYFDKGGGVYNRGTLTVTGSTISGNTAMAGGGIGNYATGSGVQAVVTITDSTLSGNSARYDGGGIYNYGIEDGSAVLTITSSTLSNNLSGYDGAGFESEANNAGTTVVTVTDSTLSGNTAGYDGGAIYNYAEDGASATLTITNSILSGNTAGDDGGGIRALAENEGLVTTSITDSTISGNRAADEGGGLYNTARDSNSQAILTIVRSTVSGNIAQDDGGGVYNYAHSYGSATLAMTNSTVSGNTAIGGSTGAGGGVYNYADDYGTATATLTHSTITGNSAGHSGAGVKNYADTHGVATLTLVGSLVSGNTGQYNIEVDNFSDDATATINANAANLFGHSGLTDAQAFYGFTPGGADINATSDGTNVALAAILDSTLMNNGGPTNTHALILNSPAIDAAGVCGLATDQRSFVRNVGNCDIGSYEFGAQPPADPCATAVPTMGCKVNGVLNQPCVGGAGKDVIIGTSGNDVILGGGGNDELKGNAGNDLLCGQEGSDRIFGNLGNDTLAGGEGKDVLDGDEGDDQIDGGNGNDLLLGDVGNDTLIGGAGTDKLRGQDGIDSCDGEMENTCEL